MGEQASESPESPPDSNVVWLRQRRVKIALGIAVVEGIFIAVSEDFSRWTVIIISVPIIAFYLFAGRTLKSELGREVSWVAAASQTFTVILCVVAFLIHSFALIIVGVFAVVALILLFGERQTKSSKAP